MTSYKIDVDKAKKQRKLSKDFTKQEKKILFEFLDKNPNSESAMSFVMDYYNCSMMTLCMLITEKVNKEEIPDN